MERLLFIAAVSALALAKPEIYREKEDFKYSRSSSDEGSKSGYYGAQRGNMGGNYERSHNMDGLAQHQMSGLVRTVEGELGDGSNTRTGNVFTAANSKGIYGSGHYDLSNLEGRNFAEGLSFGDSQSSLSSHSGFNADASASNNMNSYSSSYSKSSRSRNGYNGYVGQSSRQTSHAFDTSGQSLGNSGQVANLQEVDSSHGVRRYDYGGQEASGRYSQSAYQGQSAYETSNTNSHSSGYGANVQNRLISAMPVKVVVRPGTRVPIPIATQTVDTANTGNVYSQNSLNSEAETLNNQYQPNAYKPTGQAKHYESAYSYHKEWEKHDTKPVLTPTENPFPKNSELYEDTQTHTSGQQYGSAGLDSYHSHSNNAYSGYNANVKSTSSNQYQQQSNYKDQQYKASTLDSNANGFANYNSGLDTHVNNQIGDSENKPKSYQSSYSYHKSWERQGDPYVIKPVSTINSAQESQRLTAASSNLGTWSSQYGGHSKLNNQYYLNAEDCNCEEDSNVHIRRARSYNTNYQQHGAIDQDNELGQQVQDLGQQAQNVWENLEDLGQQTHRKWDKLEETGQQTQRDNLESLGQQTQSQWDRLEETGQQAQNKWDNLESLGQQTQNQWGKSEDAGQQTQNNWDTLETTGQQAQSKWDKIEDLGQQTQNQWSKSEEPGQQTQNNWDKLEDLTLQHQNQMKPFVEQAQPGDVGKEHQNSWTGQSDTVSIPTQRQQKHNTWMLSPEIPVTLDTEMQSDHKLSNNQEFYRISKPDVTNRPYDVGSNNNKESGKENIFNILSATNVNNKKPTERKAWNSEENKEIVHHTQMHNIETLEDTTKSTESFGSENFNNYYNYKPMWSQTEHKTDDFNPSFTHFGKPSQFNNPFINSFGTNRPQDSEQHTFYNSNFHTQSNTRNSYEESHHHSQNHGQSQGFFKHNESYNNYHSTPNTPTLSNLWDKIENIEKQSSNNDNYYSSSQTQNQEGNINKYSTGYFSHKLNISPYMSDSSLPNAFDKEFNQLTSNHNNSITTEIGRGDIGADQQFEQNVTSTEKNFKTRENENIFVIFKEPKLYKTPAEIESLSQIHQKTDRSITIIKEQNNKILDEKLTPPTLTLSLPTNLDDKYTHRQGMTNTNKVTNQLNFGTTQKNAETGFQNVEQQSQSMESQNSNIRSFDFGNANLHEQQSTDQNFKNFGQSTNFDQQYVATEATNLHGNKYPLNSEAQIDNKQSHPQQQNGDRQFEDQLNTEQQFESFNQQSEQQNDNLNQQFEQKFNFDQNRENINQENTNQQFETFGKTENLDQQNIGQEFEQSQGNSQKQNTEQQFESFNLQNGQQNGNLGQQQFEESHSGNINHQNPEQQFDSFNQQSEQQNENFNQQFEQKFSFDQNRENIDQENINQQFETFGKSENLDQQNIGQEFEQSQDNSQKQNTEQQFETFNLQSGQQNGNLDQQQFEESHSGNINHHNTEQRFESFAGSDFNQQNKEIDFGQQTTNLNQQSFDQEFANFGQINDNLNHQQQTQQFKNHEISNKKFENNQQPVQFTNVEEDLRVIPVQNPKQISLNHENQEVQNNGKQGATNEDISKKNTDSPKEPTTEKPGFWKNIQNKFDSTKEKVFSWFRSS